MIGVNMKFFVWTCRALSAIPLITGLLGIALGLSQLVAVGVAIPEDVIRNASIDNQWRFFGVVWTGYAALIWYATSDIKRHWTLLRILLLILALSGAGRALSVALTGWPIPPFIGAMMLELIGMPLLYFWARALIKSQP
jgi:hypothetical protein